MKDSLVYFHGELVSSKKDITAKEYSIQTTHIFYSLFFQFLLKIEQAFISGFPESEQG